MAKKYKVIVPQLQNKKDEDIIWKQGEVIEMHPVRAKAAIEAGYLEEILDEAEATTQG